MKMDSLFQGNDSRFLKLYTSRNVVSMDIVILEKAGIHKINRYQFYE